MKCSSHKGFSENSQGERICRICHLAFGPASDASIVESASATSGDFIQLGCVCKDELDIAHVYCAEVWFKLKGSRLCELCGETAKNVSGVTTNRVMEEWNDRRFSGDIAAQIKHNNKSLHFKVDTESNVLTIFTLTDFVTSAKAVAFIRLPDYKSGKIEVQYLHDHAGFTTAVDLSRNTN
ncbi:outer plastidial membrane protein porin-like [Vicia villosa]|uniref:outer plastidial membrane protein porin-like n=1 Tax=Vicia villosa TaxID=3911 RepID=UPI00273BFA0D|nr:outer plastidial membrane protein porin-like [Vicia villosa]